MTPEVLMLLFAEQREVEIRERIATAALAVIEELNSASSAPPARAEAQALFGQDTFP